MLFIDLKHCTDKTIGRRLRIYRPRLSRVAFRRRVRKGPLHMQHNKPKQHTANNSIRSKSNTNIADPAIEPRARRPRRAAPPPCLLNLDASPTCFSISDTAVAFPWAGPRGEPDSLVSSHLSSGSTVGHGVPSTFRCSMLCRTNAAIAQSETVVESGEG